MPEPIQRAKRQVDSALDYQDRKWGQQTHSDLRWLAILAEEFGEVSKEICNALEKDRYDPAIELEIAQVAAVCIAWLEQKERAK